MRKGDMYKFIDEPYKLYGTYDYVDNNCMYCDWYFVSNESCVTMNSVDNTGWMYESDLNSYILPKEYLRST